jgi:hypothetical protein
MELSLEYQVLYSSRKNLFLLSEYLILLIDTGSQLCECEKGKKASFVFETKKSKSFS